MRDKLFEQLYDKDKKYYIPESSLEIHVYCGYGYMYQIKDDLLVFKMNGAPVFNPETGSQFTKKDWSRIKRQANKIGTPAHPKYKLN